MKIPRTIGLAAFAIAGLLFIGAVEVYRDVSAQKKLMTSAQWEDELNDKGAIEGPYFLLLAVGSLSFTVLGFTLLWLSKRKRRVEPTSGMPV